MNNLFNNKVNRKNTNTYKWDFQTNSDNLPFWIADSDYKTAPCVIEELQEVSKFGVYGYNQVPDKFKEVICSWYKKRYNADLNKEWIIPTTGVILEIRLMLEILTNKGDGVILQTPVYHTFHHVINGMERKIIENKLIKKHDTYIMDYDNLENLFKQGYKVMILCSPHNPVGRIWTKEEIEKVISLAKKYNVFVIIDEIHSDLNITNTKFTSGADFISMYDNIVLCNAPSKAFNLAGLCTSYIIIPNEKYRELFNKQVDREFLNSPTVFGYSATIAAYSNGYDWINAQNEHIKNNYLYLKEYLNKELPNLIVTKLEGTYLVWLDLSYTNLSTEELLDKCNNAGITCSGGVNFCQDYESYLRFNIACPFEQLEEGLKRLVKAFK
ncbi:MAG: pyridoxal phosphate-dependent aminotransferase [Bacilli bacterium]|nr:pyridoxal phosphate-dependent aminotransferase [Bacilli bacterium]